MKYFTVNYFITESYRYDLR